MELTVLIDNQTIIDRYYRAEPGASYWISYKNKQILFDTGYSELFLTNARKMGIDPAQADYVIISHGHNDHAWGLQHLIAEYTERRAEGMAYKRPGLVAHPYAFEPKRFGALEIGSVLDPETLGRHMTLQLSANPFEIEEGLFWLGEIPRIHEFEGNEAVGQRLSVNSWQPDYLADDSAVACCTENGLFIITGCSHAGICNIISHAQVVTGVQHISGILGGFHLLKPSAERMQGTLSFFKDNGISQIYAGHCTDFESRAAFASVVNQCEIGVGFHVHR